jgi:hypothetical protein
MKVDFPHPDGPMKAVISRCLIFKETFTRAGAEP